MQDVGIKDVGIKDMGIKDVGIKEWVQLYMNSDMNCVHVQPFSPHLKYQFKNKKRNVPLIDVRYVYI